MCVSKCGFNFDSISTKLPKPADILRASAISFATSLFLLTSLPVSAEPEKLETLLGAKTTSSGLTITVTTGGCTHKPDFEISAQPTRKRAADIEIKRTTRDSCKGFFPAGLKLNFTWAELKLPKGTKLTIKNPIEKPRKSSSR